MMSASARKRTSALGERACSTLIATCRRGDSCSAAYTVPIPPSPSTREMR